MGASGSAPFGDVPSAGAPFTTLADGQIWVTVYETWVDDGVNAQVSAGTLTVFYQPVPEPATYGLMALGLLAVGGAARRRRG
jgi:hypothetical protein